MRGGGRGGISLEVARQGCKIRYGVVGLREAREVGEDNRKLKAGGGSSIGSADKAGRGQGAAGENKERVVDCGTSNEASRTQGSRSGGQGAVVKVATADADRASARRAIGRKRGSKGKAQWVAQDSRAHGKRVVKQSHEGRAVAKGDPPRVGVRGIDHGRHDVLGLHAALPHGGTRVGNTFELGTRGEGIARIDAASKLTQAGRQGTGKLADNFKLKLVTVMVEAHVANRADAAHKGPGADNRGEVRARDINLVPERAEHKGTSGGVAGLEHVTNPVDVIECGTPTCDTANRVRARRAESEDAVSVHSTEQVAKVGRAGGTEVRESKQGQEPRAVATDDARKGSARA